MRNPHNEPLAAEKPSKRTAGETSPERRCVLTGNNDTRGALVRLALSPSGEVAPDALARAPGRGAWIGVTRRELEAAIAAGKLKGALARAFKGAPLAIPADLAERTEIALTRAVTDRLGIELRAGNVLLGTEKIAQGCRSGAVAWLGHACDASDDGVGKLAQAWRVGESAEGSGMKGVILPLDRATLSVALGRDNVVHLALTDDAAAERLAAPLRRLLHFLGRDAGTDDGAAQVADGAADGHAASAVGDDFDTKGE